MAGSTGGRAARPMNGAARPWRGALWAVWMVAAAWLGGLWPAVVQAQQAVVAFGPQAVALQPQGNRPASKTDTYTWTRKQGKQTNYELEVTNDSPAQAAQGGSRTSEVEVWHNGVKLWGTRDLFRANGQPVAAVRKPITVRKHNEIEVRMTGRAVVRLNLRVTALPVPVRIAELTPQRLEIDHGASGVLAARLEPVPRVAGTLTVATNRDDTADAPRQIRYAAGQQRVAVPVYGEGVGTAQITVRLNDSSDSSRIQVNPAPSRVVALTPLTGIAEASSA